MPEKVPTISEVIDRACVYIKAAKGYDVNAAEGRAFTRQFWFQILRMGPKTRVKFIARCLKYYDGKMKRENND